MSAADKHGHDHGHSHDHKHDHAHGGDGHTHKAAPMVEEITDYEVLEIAVRELAIEHGLFSAEDHRKFTEWAESVGPAAGSRMVAKAWKDPAFKARLLKDATEASKEVGIDWAEPTGFGTPSDYTNFRVLENTPTLHHVIVCTLCSCYPRPVLGMSPEWYRSTNYRRRLVRWPREVIAEFGLILPPEVEIRVEDSNQKCRFMVMPMRPPGTDNWSEEQLAAIVTRDCMIGVALPQPGRTEDIHPVHKARRPVQSSAQHAGVAR
jgi:thiocyanate hydrolase subunit gamma